MSISCDLYNYNLSNFIINKKIINPSFYDLNIINKYEKNWSLFNYNGDMAIVYSWCPILIGKINVDTNLLSIIDIKYNIPEHFKDSKGTTPGFIFNNEIWFILHKSQRNINYQHFFVVFDLNMNLLRYSELFKLENQSIEFCMGLIIENDTVILSYSIMDTSTKISTYSIDYINNNLLWYENDKINLLLK
jgi:hypothetical protein